jgi:GAF domain-containing protein
MINRPPADRSQSPTPFRRLWSWLTDAHPSIAEVSQRRRAQFAAGTSLIAFLVSAVGVLVISTDHQARAVGALRGSEALLLLLLTAYILCRTRYHTIGALMTSLGFCSMAYITILIGGADTIAWAIYSFVPLALILGSALLSVWIFFILMIFNVAIIVALPSIGMNVSSMEVGTLSSVVLAIGMMLMVINNFRAGVEHVRMNELRTANLELQTTQTALEKRVEERTTELDRRSTQLETAAFIARQAAAITELDALLNEVVQTITNRFGYYHAGIFLVDESGRFVVLQASSSEGGQRMLERGHQLEIGREGIVGYAAYQKRPRIALDVGAEAVYFNNPDLPLTRSEIALPLIVRNKIIGVLDIQSIDTNAFTQNDIYALQTMADQIALAIENARLLSESRLAIQQLQSATSEVTHRLWKENVKQQAIGYHYTPLGVSPLTKDKAERIKEGSIVEVPIHLHGQKIGMITLKRKGSNAYWTEKESGLATEIAAQVGLALDNARLLEESQRRAFREQTVNQISGRFSRSLDVDTLLQTAVRELQQLPNVSEVSVYVGQANDSDFEEHQ